MSHRLSAFLCELHAIPKMHEYIESVSMATFVYAAGMSAIDEEILACIINFGHPLT